MGIKEVLANFRNFDLLRKYLPEKAKVVKKREEGAFNVYEFRVGPWKNFARLIVRRRYENALFPRHWQLNKPAKRMGNRLSWDNPSNELHVGKHLFVFREPTVWPQRTQSRLSEEYAKVLKAGIRFEQPVAVLERTAYTLGSQRIYTAPILITRKQRGVSALAYSMHLLEDSGLASKIAKGVLFELGKMHGAGVTHAHLHEANILVNQQGDVRLIDPKLLGLRVIYERELTTKTRHNSHIIDEFEALTTKRELGDIMQFALTITKHLPTGHWKEIAAEYKRGKELSRERIERWEERERRRLTRK